MKRIVLSLIAVFMLISSNVFAQGDSCPGAAIPSTCTWYTGSNVGFTVNSGFDDTYAPGDICAISLENTAWYSFTPTVTGTYDIIFANLSCSGGGAAIQAGVLTGPCGGPYTALGCNTQPGGNNCFEIAGIAMTAGTTYYIVNDGDANAQCTWDINICPSTCLLTPDVGTFTITQNGSPATSPIYLCEEGNDCLSFVSNDDYVLPPAFGCEISEVVWEIHTGPTATPGNAGTYVGTWTGEDFTDCNVSTYGFEGVNNGHLYFYPVTYDDGDNGGDPNGLIHHDQNGDGCWDMGAAIEVYYLAPIAVSTSSNACTGTVTLTVTGGQPEFTAANYTVTNNSNGSLAGLPVSHNGSFQITGLNNGDGWSVTITDANGCSNTFTGTYTGDTSDPSWTDPSTICASAGSINLNTLITGTSGGTWSGTGVSGNTFNPASGTQNVTYSVGPCPQTEMHTITVIPDVDPSWTDPSSICASAGSINLNSLITGTTGGSWSGTGVSGNTFNPASGTQNVTYTVGTAPCQESQMHTITVIPDVDPSWTDPSSICASAGSINLNSLITGTTGGSWSGTGVSGNTFNPASGTQNVTYTVGTAPCQESQMHTITVIPDVDPSWTDPSSICASAGSINLNSLITGTTGGSWSGTGVSGNTFNPASGTQNVTYTVGTAPCQESQMHTITVIPDVDPSWTDPSSICASAGSINLNSLITGTIGGSWSGTGVSGNTFNPASGTQNVTYTVGTAPCQESQMHTITVIPDVDPSWTDPSSICASAGSINLNSLITGTTGGSWSGTGVSGNTFNPASGTQNVTYTVGTAPCQESQMHTITVIPDVDPSWTDPSSICASAGSINLNSLITGTTGGSWSGTGVSGNTFNPASGTQNVTYTVGTAPCQESQMHTITVIPDVDPSWTDPSSICASAGSINLNSLITGTTGGSWSGTGVSGNTFNPASGTQNVTYTVGTAPCQESQMHTITVIPDVDPSWTDPSSICASAGSINLNSLITGTTGGSWSGTGVSGNTFNPASGTQNVTYTVGTAPCQESQMHTITVIPDVDSTWTNPGPLCEGSGAIDLNNFVTGTTGGTWTGTGVTGSMFDPSGLSGPINVTYTVGTVPCQESLMLAIQVDPEDDASFSYSSGTYCVTGTDPIAISGGTQTSGGTYTISAPGVINAGTGEIDLDASGTGSFTVTYNTFSAGNPCPDTATFNVTITTAPSAAFSYDQLQYCQDSIDPVLSFGPGASGGVFSSNPSTGLSLNTGTGAITLATSTPGLYTVYNNIAAAGGCAAALDSTTIEILPTDSALFSYSPTTYCETGVDPTPVLGGNSTSGGTYTISAPGAINASTGEIDLDASGTGSFTVYYNTSSAGNSCPALDSTVITITPAPDAAFSYDQLQYCQDSAAPVLTLGPGATVGTYTSNPGGLSLNSSTGAVDLINSTPGLYTVYNTIAAAGGCAMEVDSTTIEVLPVDTAAFTYPSNTFCITGSDPIATLGGNSTSGGVFTISAPGVINSGDGTIDLSTSGLGSFTVYYNTTTVGNPCPEIDSVTINIVNAPGATFTYNTPFCEGDTAQVLPTFGANSFAGVFSSSPSGVTFVDTLTGEIDLTTSADGTYMIYNNLAASGGCAAALDSFQIIINPMFVVPQNAAICDGDSIMLGGSFQTAAGVYEDTLLTINGCDSIIQTTLAINPVDTVPQSAAICQGDSILLGGSFQTTAGTYYDTLSNGNGCDSILVTTLTINTVIITNVNDSICQGQTYTLPGGGIVSTAGIYNDTLSAAGGCDSVVVTDLTVNPQLAIQAMNDTTICSSGSLTLTAIGSGSGTIEWYDDSGLSNNIGTGSPLVLPNPGSGAHMYYVIETGGSCPSNTDSVLVTVGGVVANINATPTTGNIPLVVNVDGTSSTGSIVAYSWDFGNGNTSNQATDTTTYQDIGTYTITLIVTDGTCFDTARVSIDAFGESVILIPNVFTPNNDGQNDIFTVKGENLESVEVEIYNRWGQLMYQWDNVKGYWDGRTLSGSEAPDGTYFYIVNATGFDGAEYFKKGGFSLIR